MATVSEYKTKDGKIKYRIKVKIKNESTQKLLYKSMIYAPSKDLSKPEAYEHALKEAKLFEEQIRKDLEYGIEFKDYTIEEYSNIYLEFIKKNFAISYYLKAKYCASILVNKIGNIKLSKITPKVVQNYFDEVDNYKPKEEIITPRTTFREVLEKGNFTYTILRRQLKIQHNTLSKAYNGARVERIWANNLVEKTEIPFEKLFKVKIEYKELAPITKKRFKTYLRQLLAHAKRERLIKENYATSDFVFYTRDKNHKEIEAMDEEQAKIFFNTLINWPNIKEKTLLLTLLLTGFRKGEVIGLKWDDIDFNKAKISVNRSVGNYAKYGLIIKEPKTEKSLRTITVPNILIDTLKEYKTYQDNLKLKLGDYYKDENFVFSKEDGSLIGTDRPNAWLDEVLKKANLPHFKVHSLRHTNITLQITGGVPLITVSGRAGHSRTSTTTDIYSHFIKTSDSNASEILEKILEGNDSKPKEKSELSSLLQLKKKLKDLGIESIEELIKLL